MGQITPDQLQALIGYAAKRLGMTPQQLAGTVQSGGLGALADRVGSDDIRRINDLVGDRQKAEQFLSSPDVRRMMEKLLGGADDHG